MIVLIIIILLLSLRGCIIDEFKLDGFNNKDEVINAIKENIDELNVLTKEMYNEFNDNGKSFVVIENKIFKISKVVLNIEQNYQRKCLTNLKLKK